MKEAQALDVKNQFQNVVDRLRTFWADVEAALATSLMKVVQPIVVQILASTIAQLTRQLERCALYFLHLLTAFISL